MNRISNYDELMLEKQRLKLELVQQKQVISDEIQAIKENIKPIMNILSLFGVVKSGQGKANLLKTGAKVGIDLLVGSKLAKAGWLARLAVPFILKRFSSKAIDKVNSLQKKWK